MTSLLDMEAEAELNLPKDYWNWVSGGDGEGVTVRRNREAFQGISVRPRALVDTANKDMSTSMLGERIDFPVFASPAGGQWLAHPDGEVAVAGAACSKGMLMVVPTGAHKTLEEIAKATTAPLWFQLYHLTDEITEYILPRVESAGYSAVCLTVRGPGTIGGTINRHGKYSPRGDLAWGDLGEVPHLRKLIDNLDRSVHRGLTWDRMEWLRSAARHWEHC